MTTLSILRNLFTTKEPLYNKDYIFIVTGGGITVDIQCNDTHYHKGCKAFYRDQKMTVVIPSSSKNDMISILNDALRKTID